MRLAPDQSGWPGGRPRATCRVVAYEHQRLGGTSGGAPTQKRLLSPAALSSGARARELGEDT
ncbi:hypothetical protein IC235_03005 [Hymenobacter sp. BT664]|uniref:Uncharacterized protein n=1 Tax=Hymenobacter montanus TaxID=2771359 RepID=A0A927BB07_9BACT|nr:hypothetical protein [Hymenobacter montanus]MBD2766859.1 hypothetical protein [Hymenobacter montanus]